jgi:hypothetical protein
MLTTLLLVVTIVGVLTYLSVKRGFAHYVQSLEAGRLDPARRRLVAAYEHDGGWEALRRDPRRPRPAAAERGRRAPRPTPRGALRRAAPGRGGARGRRATAERRTRAEGRAAAARRGATRHGPLGAVPSRHAVRRRQAHGGRGPTRRSDGHARRTWAAHRPPTLDEQPRVRETSGRSIATAS